MLTDILIHMGADIPTGPTDIMDRRSTSGRHFIGTAAIEFTTRGTIDIIITGAGTKLKRPDFRGRRVKSPAGFYFFGDVDPAGADVDVADGDGS